MQLSTHVGNFDGAKSLKLDIAEAIQSAVDRFGSRVRKVSVSIRDVNGPRGGEDKQCRCVVHLNRMSPIVIEETGASYGSLLHCVAQRLTYNLSQRVERLQQVRRTHRGKGLPELNDD